MTLCSKLSITWPEITNERSVPMLWLGAWLLGPDGEDRASVLGGNAARFLNI